MFGFRARNSIKTSSVMPVPSSDNPLKPHPKLDAEPSPQETSTRRRHTGTSRPKSARAGQRTSEPPPPGWRNPPQDDSENNAEFSEDEEPGLEPPSLEHSIRRDGPDSSRNMSRRRTPPPSPRRTPEPVGGTHRSPKTAARRPPKADRAASLPKDPLNSAFVLLMVIALALAGWRWYTGGGDLPPRVEVDGQSLMKAGVQRWRTEVVELASRFPYQRQRLWRVLRAAVSRMLLESRQPAVVLLLASEAERDDVRCVLDAAAAAVLNATQSAGRPLRVDGAALGALDEQEAKGRLNTQLDRLRGGDGVAVFMVEELQRLQPLTAMLLHGFCDNDNAPRKKALFLFSVVTSRTPPGDADMDRAVEHALWQSWGQVLSEDIFHALLGRIAGNVAAVADEGSELLCHKTRP